MTYEEYLGITAEEVVNAEMKIPNQDDDPFEPSNLGTMLATFVINAMDKIIENDDFDPGHFAFAMLMWGLLLGLLVAKEKSET